MELQSIVFEKDHFTKRGAEKWLDNNGYKKTYHGKTVDETKHTYRYRQLSPRLFEHFITKKMAIGIMFIYGKKN